MKCDVRILSYFYNLRYETLSDNLNVKKFFLNVHLHII